MLHPRFDTSTIDLGIRGPQSILSDTRAPLTTTKMPEFEPFTISDDYIKALRRRDASATKAAEELARERDKQARQAATGALIQMLPSASMKILTGMDVNNPNAQRIMEFANQQAQKALEARQRRDEISAMLPYETDVQVAEQQMEADRSNQDLRNQFERDRYRLGVNRDTQREINELTGQRQKEVARLNQELGDESFEKREKFKRSLPPSFSEMTQRHFAQAQLANALQDGTGGALDLDTIERGIRGEMSEKMAELNAADSLREKRVINSEIRALEEQKNALDTRRRVSDVLPDVDFDFPTEDDLVVAGNAVRQGELDTQDAVRLAETMFMQGELTQERLVDYLRALRNVAQPDARR